MGQRRRASSELDDQQGSEWNEPRSSGTIEEIAAAYSGEISGAPDHRLPLRIQMDFESLAFGSAGRCVPTDTRATFCPACQENCVPELTCVRSERIPTCPTCGGPTSAAPAPDIQTSVTPARMVRGSTDLSATSAVISTVSVNANAGAASPSPFPSAAVPPTRTGTGAETHDTQERPTAVRDRVAQEVLTLMAAIERGEVPTAVGLPLPPGANIFDSLRGPGGLGGERARRSSAPASKEALRRLTRFKVEENSWVLHQTTLRISGPTTLSIDALFAPFSFRPASSVSGPLVFADPPTAHDALVQNSDVRGSILVVDRGVCTFASKAFRAQAAGALAVVVVQTFDVWPYMMEDTRGEAKAGDGLRIPMCMVSKANGKLLRDAAREMEESRTCIHAELSVDSSDRDCIVCQELFTVGATLVRLPCQHVYHESCLLKWLKLSNTCPYCRRELPTSNLNAERERRRDGAGNGDDAWRQYFY